MAKEWRQAGEVQAIAERLIEILKPELAGFEIRSVFCSENPKKDGRECAALARKVVGLNAYLADGPDGFFVIEVGRPAWDELDADGRIALVLHELCHFGVSDSGGLEILPHDVEEFTAVVKVFGAWRPELHVFADALRQGDESPGTRDEIKRRILGG